MDFLLIMMDYLLISTDNDGLSTDNDGFGRGFKPLGEGNLADEWEMIAEELLDTQVVSARSFMCVCCAGFILFSYYFCAKSMSDKVFILSRRPSNYR